MKIVTPLQVLKQKDKDGLQKYWIGQYGENFKMDLNDVLKAMEEYASQFKPPLVPSTQKPDFEAMIKKSAFKSHPLNTYPDAISIDDAEYLMEELWNTYVSPPLLEEGKEETKTSLPESPSTVKEETQEDLRFLLGKKIRYRYIDWEAGSYTPWIKCNENDLRKLEDRSIDEICFKPQ